MGIQLVVFDIAGTTLRDEHNVTQVFKSALLQFGYDVPAEKIDPLMGYEKRFAIRRILESSDNGPAQDKIVVAIHEEFISQMISFYETEELQVLPNVEETFVALRQRGVKIGINTGFSRDIAMTIMDRLGWERDKLIDAVIASDEVPVGRPEPFMIRSMMHSLNIFDPLQVAKVGDTEVDMREGQFAGCRFVIGITTGIFSREELALYHPTHIVDDIGEIISIVTE